MGRAGSRRARPKHVASILGPHHRSLNPTGGVALKRTDRVPAFPFTDLKTGREVHLQPMCPYCGAYLAVEDEGMGDEGALPVLECTNCDAKWYTWNLGEHATP